MTVGTIGNDSPWETPRPLKLLPEPLRRSARRALENKLMARGMSHSVAVGVAAALADPVQAEALLDTPTKYRVPGAELSVIRTRAYTVRVVADATNPRTINDVVFPAAADRLEVSPSVLRPLEPPRQSGDAEFRLTVDSMGHLTRQLDLAMRATVKRNTPRPPISEQGVMEPPLAVPLSVTFTETDESLGFILVREGSTRLSHAQEILEVTAADLLGRFREDRHLLALIRGLNDLAQGRASSLQDADAGRIRVCVIPIDLVVGVETDGPPTATSLEDAVAAKVAQDHINHKQQWDDAARDSHLGEACLTALYDAGLLTDTSRLWLGGRLTSHEARAASLGINEDDRWAELVWLFTTRRTAHARAVRRPIAASLDRDAGRRNVRRSDKVPLAVALAMRAKRGTITEIAADREARILESSVLPAAWEINWQPTLGDVGNLVEVALQSANDRTPRAEAVELATRAAWYIARDGLLAMPRNDLGPGGDRRLPAELIEELLRTPRGVRQLGRIVEDGRSGHRAALVADESGRLEPSALGTPVPVTDEAVRNDLAPRGGAAPPPPVDATQRYVDAAAMLARAVREAHAADQGLRAIADEHGHPLHEARGLEAGYVADIRPLVDELGRHLTDYAATFAAVSRASAAQVPRAPQQ